MVGEIKTAYWVPLRLPSAVEGLYVHKSGRKEIRCLTKPHSLLSHAASFLSDAQQDDECWEKYVQVPTKLAVGTGSNATQLDDATSQQRPFPVLEPKKVPMKNHRCGGAVNLQTLAMKLSGGGGKQWGSAWTLADGQFRYTRLLLPVALQCGTPPRLFYTCL